MATKETQYECILLGATGYTGRFTAEHITSSLPTDFRWAVAGRNEAKLQSLVDDLRTLNPDRAPPAIEVAQHNKDDLLNLAKKARVLITTVGPYHKYGTPVLAACAETGTHYVDATGELPWVYDMIQAYDAKAKASGSIIISQCGVESAPTDIMCWALVSHIRETLHVGTAEFIHVIREIVGVPSGGTFATLLSIFDEYSWRDFAKKAHPFSLTAVPRSSSGKSRPILEKVTGVRTVSDLGTLTDSIQGPTDAPIVNRTWSLYDGGSFYGPNFSFSAYSHTRNIFTGFLYHLAFSLGLLALLMPPLRWLLKRWVYQPGEGATKE